MTASIPRRLTTSNVVPPTQNTAPVLEFGCLYTSDLRRKQKRWQDGRLKFHTFNKRVMVYDDRGNFVGDTHWREDYVLAEGEEVELERSATLVQVSECLGIRDQDLTGLLDKRMKEREERVVARAMAPSPLQNSLPITRPKSLAMLLPEQSQQRFAKRRKQTTSQASKDGYAKSLTGAPLTLSGMHATTTSLSYDPSWLRTLRHPIEHVDLSSGEIEPMPQKTRISYSPAVKQPSEIQAKTKREIPPSIGRISGYARNLTGAALILGGRVRINGGKPSHVIRQWVAVEGQQNPPEVVTTALDDFIDINGYDKRSGQSEGVQMPSPSISRLVHVPQDKPRQQPPPTIAQVAKENGDQQLQHFNPLRIKPRPKRKLLLMARPEPQPYSDGEIFQGHEELIEASVYQAKNYKRPLSEATRRLDTFYDVQEQCLNTRISASRSHVIGEYLPSSQEIEGIDHNNIDKLLSRKQSRYINKSKIEKTKDSVRVEPGNSDSTEKSEAFPDGIESEQSISSIPGAVKKAMGKQCHMQHIVPPALEIPLSFGDYDSSESIGETDILFAGADKISPSRLLELPSTTQGREFISLMSGIDRHLGHERPTKQDILLSEQQTKPTEPRCLEQRVVRQENRGGRGMESQGICSIAVTEPRIRALSGVFGRGDVNNNEGPWSREAFDLFDCHPSAVV